LEPVSMIQSLSALASDKSQEARAARNSRTAAKERHVVGPLRTADK
jgi:hypothetical protein